ncbi:SRPBCC domain-containing protein [Kytococcus sedentarius]|uniref:SRPBCC domain-containing protein n=1 Tax=Kytococcus sedentarius TaxID=1276 RepID=UPI0035BC7A4D
MDETLSWRMSTWIAASPQQVWDALTDAEATARFWQHHNVSDWQVGSVWEHRRLGDGAVDCHGVVREAVPGERLGFTFEDPAADPAADDAPLVTITLIGGDGVTQVDLVHVGLRSVDERDSIEFGWQAVFANLKTMLETGEPLPVFPWEVHAG